MQSSVGKGKVFAVTKWMWRIPSFKSAFFPIFEIGRMTLWHSRHMQVGNCRLSFLIYLYFSTQCAAILLYGILLTVPLVLALQEEQCQMKTSIRLHSFLIRETCIHSRYIFFQEDCSEVVFANTIKKWRLLTRFRSEMMEKKEQVKKHSTKFCHFK